jgi:hypothetical protein
LNLTHDETLSSFAFNFNLRHYTKLRAVLDAVQRRRRARRAREQGSQGGVTAGAYTRPLFCST